LGRSTKKKKKQQGNDRGLLFKHQSQCSLIQKLLGEKKLLREGRQGSSKKFLWLLQKKAGTKTWAEGTERLKMMRDVKKA